MAESRALFSNCCRLIGNSVGVEMKFIPTYIEASGIKKIAYFIRAYMNIEKNEKKQARYSSYSYVL